MRESFDKAVAFTIARETSGDPNGAYTNDPNDPGGETRWGIAKRYHPNVDIKNLTLEAAKEIYLNEYWIKAGCDQLSSPLDIAAFDSAVNPGIGWVTETLQNIGDWRVFLFQRLVHYAELVRTSPAKAEYLGGWTARCCDLWNLCGGADNEQKV